MNSHNKRGKGNTYEELVKLATQSRNLFFESSTFFTALELELFSKIGSEGSSINILREKTGLNPTGLELLLNSLVAMKLLRKEGCQFFVNAPYIDCLSHEKHEMRKVFLSYKKQLVNWLNMKNRLKMEAEPAQSAVWPRTASLVSHYLEPIRHFNQPHIDTMISRLAPLITSVKNIMDLGGGHGYCTEKILEMNNQAEVTILDKEGAIRYGEEQFQDNPHRQRVKFVVGDALALPYKKSFDLIITSDLLHYFTNRQKGECTRLALGALVPGGTLAILKFRLEDDGIFPLFSAFFSLKLHLSSQNGCYLETDVELISMLRENSEIPIEVKSIRINDVKTLLVARRKA